MFANGIAPTRRFRLLHAPNPYGYSISPAGARRLLKACVPFTAELISYFNEPGAMLANMGFDRELARRYAELRAFIVQPLLGVVPEAADRRTITAHFVRSFHHLAGQGRLAHARAPGTGAMTPLRVISLDRTPDRLAIFRQTKSRSRVRNVSPAVDGAARPREAWLADGLIAPDNVYVPGAIGCAASHVALWRLCRRTQRADPHRRGRCHSAPGFY